MIDIRAAKHYCSEPIQNIENYEQAISDSTQTWDCHHRIEEKGFKKKQLIEMGMYYGRPACELIFLTEKEHYKIHTVGKANPFYGKQHSEESIEKGRRKQIEDNLKGKTVYQYNMDGSFVTKYQSTKDASRKLGYDSSSISKCCIGKMKQYKNFIWSYQRLHNKTISDIKPLF